MALTCVTKCFAFRAVHSLSVGTHKESTHGHRYLIEVSSLIGAEQKVFEAVLQHILPCLEGRDLAKLVSIATGEVLVEWIHNQLNHLGHGSSVLGVALQETRKNRFVSSQTVEHLL